MVPPAPPAVPHPWERRMPPLQRAAAAAPDVGASSSTGSMGVGGVSSRRFVLCGFHGRRAGSAQLRVVSARSTSSFARLSSPPLGPADLIRRKREEGVTWLLLL
ncbi:hypothetical protein QYE76_060513 [Lolium multiflorum]|uniref:Uncharacterized protein n=1 Tax=Lolium multiflorum TaxID=4521 RepID=A0AAD8W4B9_LOLMU|nr:hypothetical protein QYE76_060513 [Lolium multiflorum]